MTTSSIYTSFTGYTIFYNLPANPALTDPNYQENWKMPGSSDQPIDHSYKTKLLDILQNPQANQADFDNFIDSTPSWNKNLNKAFADYKKKYSLL